MTDNATIIAVDDDEAIRELLDDFFSGQGFRIITLDSGEALRTTLEEVSPDIVLLDVGLPGEDGLSLARHVREHFDTGIIMVSGAGETVDRIIGLEVGADDYVSKPFDLRELLARIKSVLRRYQSQPDTHAEEPSRAVSFGIGTLDLQRCQLLTADDREIPITAMEFEMMKVFAERPDRPLSRDQLLNLTQHRDWDPYDRSVDIRVARIRKKIEPDPDKPVYLKTVRGIGYMFVPEPR